MATTKARAAAAEATAAAPAEVGVPEAPTPESMIDDAAVAGDVPAVESSTASDAPSLDDVAPADVIHVVGAVGVINGEAVLEGDEDVRSVVLVETLQTVFDTFAPGNTVLLPTVEADRLVRLGAAVDPDAPAIVAGEAIA